MNKILEKVREGSHKHLPVLSKMFVSKKETHAKKPAASVKKQVEKKPAFMRFSNQDQILFAKRLGMVLRSGLPIMEGIHMLRDEARTSSSIYIYESLSVDIANGQTLSSGLAKFQRIFGDFGVNIVRVGETTGTLHQNLEYLAEELKRKQSLKRKVVGALVYPAVIIVATIGITIMLTVFIFPKIIPIFQSVKATLPWSTRVLIIISSFLEAHGIKVFFGMSAVVIAYFASLKLFKPFHYAMDQVLLSLPLLGKLSKFYNLVNISRTMSLLLRSDVRIVEAMDLVAGSTKNLVYKKALLEARERIVKGQKISVQFRTNSRLFPSMMAQMVTMGETTGNLAGTLSYLSEMYEEEINELTKNLTTLLEPILMIVMGLVVGFIAISIITPIYSITSTLNPH